MELIGGLTLACVGHPLVLDCTNGFPDTANMSAAAVATQAMDPQSCHSSSA
jgi:phosphate/sulfate permease